MIYYEAARKPEEARVVEENDEIGGEYVCVKALENGVTIIGMTRGPATRFLHTEKLDAGEVILLQFTQNTSAMKIRGRAEIHTRHGVVHSGGPS